MSEFRRIVIERLGDLIANTTLSPELCTSLMSRGLLTKSQYEELNNFSRNGLHTKGAEYLYTSIAPKIILTNEDKFIECLREGKNDKVVSILRPHSPGESGEEAGRVCLRRLVRAEVEFLREFVEGKFGGKGKFEGLRWEDEERANGVLRGSVRGGGSAWRLSGTEGAVETAEGEEFIETVRSVVKCVEEGNLWWNPNSVPLPPNFIPRRVRRLTNSGDEWDSGAGGESVWLSELTSVREVFLWLVDPPGMGKSTVTTKLEEEWRRSTPSPRVIVRINLNLVQRQLQQQQQQDEDDFSLVSFLKRFVPFLPLDSLCLLPGGSVGVVVLLDALDEVLPQHEATMLRLLHKLLLSPKEAKELDFTSLVLRRPDIQESLRLQKVFLTTRPHLRGLVETEFEVTAHSLLPLDEQEQVEFLRKEVSGEFEFTEDDAQRKLSSLPASAQGLMENPLMLFLFAQVVKLRGEGGDSADLDLLSLYERFMVAKHAIHVAEKEPADPAHPNTRRRMRSLFEENLPFYCAIALKQLKPKEKETWGKFVTLPSEKKRAELLSFGLLTQNSAPQLKFVHRSFAEFLYARLLTAPSTPAPLRHTLLTQIYSCRSILSFPLVNVEEFVLWTIKRRQSDGLLPLRPHWLPDSTWWQRLGEQQMEDTLKKLLEGRLFPVLWEELLSSRDLSHPQVIKALTSAAVMTTNVLLREWLTGRDPQWIRQHLFALPPPTTTPTTTPIPKWTYRLPDLVTLLLFDHPHFLSRCLSDEEIRSGLSSCEYLVRIVCDHPKSRQRQEIVEQRIGGATLQKLMMSEPSREATLRWNEAAWWVAETLTTDQFTSSFSSFSNPWMLSYRFWRFELVWGGVFVYRLVAAAAGIEWAGHAHWDLSEVSAEGMLRVFGGGEEGVAALSFLIPRVGDVGLLEELEELEERGGRGDWGGGADILARVFATDGHFVRDASEGSFSVLPFLIRYCTPRDLKEVINQDVFAVNMSDGGEGPVGAAFVLSVLVDHTPHTHNLLKATKSAKRSISSAPRDLWDFLSRVGVDDLRAASLSVGHSPLKGQWPLVRQVKWGQVLLTLLKNNPKLVREETLKSAVGDFLRHVPCCEAPDVLLLLLQQNSSLREPLLRQVESEVARGRRPGHFESPSLRCRLRGLIQFALQVNSGAFTEASTESAQLFVVSVLVEGRLRSPHGHSPGGWAHLTTLLPSLRQKLRREFPSEKKSPQHLVRVFPSFVTEWEWSAVLHTLRIIPSDLGEVPPQSQLRFYCHPETPLLRVWLRHFGVDKTRKVAEAFDWSQYRGPPGEAVLLAVELGSLKLLEKVAQPSVLWWRDAEGRSLLQVAVATWGEGHEVSSFLRGKFSCALNSK